MRDTRRQNLDATLTGKNGGIYPKNPIIMVGPNAVGERHPAGNNLA